MTIILKTSPEENLYVIWNPLTDGHEFIGNTKELEIYLSSQPDFSKDSFEDLLEYVNRTGTSEDDTSYGGWKDTGFIVQSNYYPEDFSAEPHRWVDRNNIGKHVQALESQKWEEAYFLTKTCHNG